jgi:K+-transporting ATPase A subunit
MAFCSSRSISALLLLTKPLAPIWRIYQDELVVPNRMAHRPENILPVGGSIRRRMRWTQYACDAWFNLLGLLAVRVARFQAVLTQPEIRRRVPDSSFNTAATSHQHQLAGLRRRGDDELPDADAGAERPELRLGRRRHGGGRAHRGPQCARRTRQRWVDLTRSVLILLPLAVVLPLLLVSQGVVRAWRRRGR